MNINFTTNEIDTKLYEKLILKYIYDHYHYKDYTRYMEQDKWIINIKRTDEYDPNFYSRDPRSAELDFSIPHGITGKGTITCYITDMKNNMITMQNMTVICHELAHMILMIYYPDKVVDMRYNDFHGKAGDPRKFFSCEVHDRVTEGRVKQFAYKLSRFKRFRFIGIDIEDITNSRNVERI